MKQSFVALRNAGAGLFASLANMLTTMILAPIIVKAVGNSAFGVYAVLVGVIALVQILRGPIMTTASIAVARNRVLQDWEETNRRVGTSILLALMLGTIGFGLFVGGGDLLYRGLGVAPELHDDVIVTTWIGGVSLLLTFPLMPFSAVLVGFQRHDLMGWVRLVLCVLRFVLILVLFTIGLRSIWVVMLATGLQMVANELTCLVIARWLCPALRPNLRAVRKADLAPFAGFGSLVLASTILASVNTQLPKWMIGASLGSKFVTYVHICVIGPLLARRIVANVSTVLRPVATRYKTIGSDTLLAETLIRGTRYSSMVASLILAPLLPIMDSFIGLWMGPGYVWLAPFAVIATIVTVFAASANVSVQVGIGCENARLPFGSAVAQFLVTFGGITLGGWLFGKSFGIYIVAFSAGLIVGWLVSCVWAARLCRASWPRLFLRAYLGLAIAVGLVVGAMAGVLQLIPVHSWTAFVGIYVAGMMLFVGLLALLSPPEDREFVRSSFKAAWRRIGVGPAAGGMSSDGSDSAPRADGVE